MAIYERIWPYMSAYVLWSAATCSAPNVRIPVAIHGKSSRLNCARTGPWLRKHSCGYSHGKAMTMALAMLVPNGHMVMASKIHRLH